MFDELVHNEYDPVKVTINSQREIHIFLLQSR